MRNHETDRQKHLRKQPPQTDKPSIQPEPGDPEEGTLDKTLADSFPASDPLSSIPDPDEEVA